MALSTLQSPYRIPSLLPTALIFLYCSVDKLPEQEKNGKLSFLDVEVSREKGKFVTTVYRKPTFSGVYTHFESFLPTVYKFGMVYTLVYRCFRICSDSAKFHEELSLLKQVFLKKDTLCHLFTTVSKHLLISCS